MSDKVITIPNFSKQQDHPSGFTQFQFKKLDGLYLQAAAAKALTYRSVECDFDEGVASYTYYPSEHMAPYLQFMIRRVGPKTVMYEIYLRGKGRIFKSGLFDKAYERLHEVVFEMIDEK
ncbi:MAG: hypothetical protein ACK4VI_03160 [Alphaproteobacteria bacterium]